MSILGSKQTFPGRGIVGYSKSSHVHYSDNHPGDPIEGNLPGMTLREHFAALAMQGLLADHKDHEDERKRVPTGRPTHIHDVVYAETCAECVARLAVEHADALLAQLEKTP